MREELLGCIPLETGPGQRADLPDVWNVAVQSGVQVTLSVDTVDAATAADLCFRVQCPGQALLSGDDEVACSFPPPAKACPKKTFVPTSTGSCQVTVGLCSGACADVTRARYALQVVGGTPTLVSDDGVPVAHASGTLTCGALGDRYTFQASAGQEVVIRSDTVAAASAASLCVAGSCTSGDRFDEYDTADCTFGGPGFHCVEKHFVPTGSALCKVQVTACHGECAANQASYRLDVGGTTALTSSGDNVALGTCGNGLAQALEVCGEPGLPACPTGWACTACECQRPMPNLVGMAPDDARTTLENAGIRLGETTPIVVTTFPPALVQTQSIPANGTVHTGDAVDMTVSIPPDTGEFLTHLGTVIETEASATAYYETIDPCHQRTTLGDWLAVNGFGTAGSEASAVYENHNDLGFGRQMHVRTNASDRVAYYVRNFRTVDDAWEHPENILATVAMEYSRPVQPGSCTPDPSQPPFIKFYTFAADGTRILKVDLDGRGDKYQPEMCTVCHGGFTSLASTNGGNIFARFIPFDLDSFEYSHLNPLLSRANQEGAFKELNRAALGGASSAGQQLVCGWYGTCALPTDFQGDFVPPGWTGVPVYPNAVKQACRGCHAQLSPDFADSSSFSAESTYVESYVCEQGRMPLARRTFENFWLGVPGRTYGPPWIGDFLGSNSCVGAGPSGQQQLLSDNGSVTGPLPPNSGDGIGGPRAIAVDDAGNVYVSGYTSSKVMKLDAVTHAPTILVDGTGGGVAPLTNATGIAVDHDGNVFVAGFTSDNVLRVTPAGAVTQVIGPGGSGGVPKFDGPFGDSIGVDDAGNLYATGIFSNNVVKRTPGGAITEIVPPNGDPQHPLTQPFALAVAGDGTCFVGGRASNNVLRVDPDGTITQIIDQTGDGQGHQLLDPYALAVGRQGSVVVVGLASKTGFRIWPDGTIVNLDVPILDSSLGLGATMDEAENAYISIRAEHNIYQFNPGGGSLTHVFNMMEAGVDAGPYDMAVDPRTRVVWVALREKWGAASIDFGHPPGQ